jgi:hypothetical protein
MAAAIASPVPSPNIDDVSGPIPVNQVGRGVSSDNFQLDVNVSEKRAVGGRVSNGKLSRTDNAKVNDGVAGSDTYKMYSGSGSTSDGWPSRDKWVSFESM